MRYYFYSGDVYDEEGDLVAKPSGIMQAEDSTPAEAHEALMEHLAENYPNCGIVLIAFNNVE